ncbi:MAG: 5'-nucleotidase, lipoprotein e(P4) family [Candidatus Aminicenantes bacterium]|nr:5'-nucleotidase, lipoprotein e(P4) family [Candidatus Aminicenantes bacterium]
MKNGKPSFYLIYALFLWLVFTMPSCNKKEGSFSIEDLNEQSLLSLVWYQNAAEVRALYHQAFNLARLRLDEYLWEREIEEKYAVVIDIDETVLDNTPVHAWRFKQGVTHPDGWDEWCRAAEAEALPGVLDFLKYADSRGCEIFYVSNRDVTLKEATLKNLKDLNFPDADEAHVLLRKETGDKEPRRQLVRKDHNIVLLIGDNLGDFASLFMDKKTDARNAAVEEHREKFGKRFIILPNPKYGDWEGTLYGLQRELTPADKNKLRRASLKPWENSQKK